MWVWGWSSVYIRISPYTWQLCPHLLCWSTLVTISGCGICLSSSVGIGFTCNKHQMVNILTQQYSYSNLGLVLFFIHCIKTSTDKCSGGCWWKEDYIFAEVHWPGGPGITMMAPQLPTIVSDKCNISCATPVLVYMHHCLVPVINLEM